MIASKGPEGGDSTGSGGRCKRKFLNWATRGQVVLFFFKYLFIYLFIFDCAGSSFLCEGFL